MIFETMLDAGSWMLDPSWQMAGGTGQRAEHGQTSRVSVRSGNSAKSVRTAFRYPPPSGNPGPQRADRAEDPEWADRLVEGRNGGGRELGSIRYPLVPLQPSTLRA